MLKEIRTLVSSTGSSSAANAAVVGPTRRASAMFSQVAENEFRRHSVPYDDAADNRCVPHTWSRSACTRRVFRLTLLQPYTENFASPTWDLKSLAIGRPSPLHKSLQTRRTLRSVRSASSTAPNTQDTRNKLKQACIDEFRAVCLASALVASLLAEEAAEEEARQSEVEASLLAEQQVGVAAVTAVTESQKRSLEKELDHAGATAEEKQARMRHFLPSSSANTRHLLSHRNSKFVSRRGIACTVLEP